jgi:hypothetical protein
MVMGKSPERSDSYRLPISRTDEEALLDGWYDEDVERSKLEERVQKMVLDIDRDCKASGQKTSAQQACQYIVVELGQITHVDQVPGFLKVIEIMEKKIDAFDQYAPLLREYALHQQQDPESMEVPQKIDELAQAYVDLCQQDPGSLRERRMQLDHMSGMFEIGGRHATWMIDVGQDVLSFLSAEDKKLKALEAAARATDRLIKRDISPEAVLLTEQIDGISHYRELNALIKQNEDFINFSAGDRVYLQRYSFEHLHGLLDANAVELEIYYKSQFHYFVGIKDSQKLKSMANELKSSLDESCTNNHLFKDKYSARWYQRLESISLTTHQGVSCVRSMVILVLASALGVGIGTFDMWKQSLGFQSMPKGEKIEKRDKDIAPVDSSPQQQNDTKK